MKSTQSGTTARDPWLRWAWALVLCHGMGLALFLPQVFTIRDEVAYVQQAVAFASGVATVDMRDPVTGAVEATRPSPYPPGTSLLMAPLVKLFGPRGAPWLSWLSLVVMMWSTARLLRNLGLREGYAGLLALFAPAAILTRHATSDLPSGACIALCLLLFFAGANGTDAVRTRALFLSGFLAGASLLLREANPLMLAPLYLGAVIRRQRGLPALIAGGLLGVALRPLIVGALFGTPWSAKTYPGFEIANLLHHGPFYLLLGSVLLPLGVPAALAYRGPRRWELVTTTVLWLLFYGTYSYAGEPSGLSKSIVLGGRFLIPIAPLWIVAIAEVTPRLGNAFAPGLPERLRRWDALGMGTTLGATLCGFILALHAGMGRWTDTQAQLRDAVYRSTPEGAAIMTLLGAEELVTPLYGKRSHVPLRYAQDEAALQAMLTRDDLFIVELTRTDSDSWRTLSRLNARLRTDVTALGDSERILVLEPTATDRLSLWRVRKFPHAHPGVLQR